MNDHSSTNDSERTSKGGVQWSKDFVEHLRTIHFALMAVSVGLVAVAMAHPTGPLDRALKQLGEIKKLVDGDRPSRHFYAPSANYSDWVLEWAETQVRRAIASNKYGFHVPEEQLIRAHGEVLSSAVWCESDTGTREYDTSGEWAIIGSADREKLDRAFVRTDIPNEGVVVETRSLGIPPDMKLDDFKKLWDFLGQEMDVVVPLSQSSKVFLWNAKDGRWDEYKCKAPTGGMYVSAFLDIGLVSDRERWAKLARRVGDEPPRYGYVSGDNTVFISLDEFQSVPFNGQMWFLSKMPGWTGGRFPDTFPELDQLSTGTSGQSLDTVKRILETKRNETGDNFEFSGVKIPTEIVMRFGILLVLGVQIYFLAHLIELSKRLQPSDEGWEVAWIGVYNHGLARFIYFCTIAVLPAASILALGNRELRQVQTQRWASLSIGGASINTANLFVLVGGMLLSSFLALRIWRKTPSRNGVQSTSRSATFSRLWKALTQQTRRSSKKTH
jgi:hypothetical protein